MAGHLNYDIDYPEFMFVKLLMRRVTPNAALKMRSEEKSTTIEALSIISESRRLLATNANVLKLQLFFPRLAQSLYYNISLAQVGYLSN